MSYQLSKREEELHLRVEKIPGYYTQKGFTYTIREDGQVKSSSNKVLTVHIVLGRPTVYLQKGDVIRTKTVHRLLAQAFIPNPDNLPEVDHRDRDKMNNSLDNLRWVSKKVNNVNSGKAVEVHWIGGPEVYPTMTKAAEALGVTVTAVSNVLRKNPAGGLVKGVPVNRTEWSPS